MDERKAGWLSNTQTRYTLTRISTGTPRQLQHTFPTPHSAVLWRVQPSVRHLWVPVLVLPIPSSEEDLGNYFLPLHSLSLLRNGDDPSYPQVLMRNR